MSDLKELAKDLCMGMPCAPEPCPILNEKSCMCVRAGNTITRLETKLNDAQERAVRYESDLRTLLEENRSLGSRLGGGLSILMDAWTASEPLDMGEVLGKAIEALGGGTCLPDRALEERGPTDDDLQREVNRIAKHMMGGTADEGHGTEKKNG